MALLSQSVARQDVARGRLVRLLPEWEPEPVELCALYSSKLSNSPKVRAFLQFLKERFRGDTANVVPILKAGGQRDMRR